ALDEQAGFDKLGFGEAAAGEVATQAVPAGGRVAQEEIVHSAVIEAAFFYIGACRGGAGQVVVEVECRSLVGVLKRLDLFALAAIATHLDACSFGQQTQRGGEVKV